MTAPLRPCWVCRTPVPDGMCVRHPRTAYQYRPGRASVAEGAYSGVHRALRLVVLERDDWTCGYCHGAASTADHVTPRSRGGTTRLDNLLACCQACNRSKKDRTLSEWVASGTAPMGALVVLERMQA